MSLARLRVFHFPQAALIEQQVGISELSLHSLFPTSKASSLARLRGWRLNVCLVSSEPGPHFCPVNLSCAAASGCIFFRQETFTFRGHLTSPHHPTNLSPTQPQPLDSTSRALATQSLLFLPASSDAHSFLLAPCICSFHATRPQSRSQWPKSWTPTGARRLWQGKQEPLLLMLLNRL